VKIIMLPLSNETHPKRFTT